MASVYLSPSTQQDNEGVGNYGTEEYRMNQLCDRVIHHLNNGGTNLTIYRNNPSMTIYQVAADSNSKKPDIHVAIHSNSGGGQGTEVWCSGSVLGTKLATLIYNGVAPHTIGLDRGVKVNTNYIEVGGVVAISCILEVMFHDRLEDVNDYLSKVDTIALAIAMSIYAYFGFNYSPPTPVPEKKVLYRVCVGTYAKYENATNRVSEMKNKGIDAYIIPFET